MAAEDDLYKRVVELISRVTSVHREKINAETRVRQDLGVDGDDAAELMRKFSEVFSVDLAEFKFNRHFGPDAGFNPIIWLFYKASGRLNLIDIRVRDLVFAASVGKWTVNYENEIQKNAG